MKNETKTICFCCGEDLQPEMGESWLYYQDELTYICNGCFWEMYGD